LTFPPDPPSLLPLAPHSRLRYEADATAKAQLRDGAALRETIDALDAAGRNREGRAEWVNVSRGRRGGGRKG
jgi:hypothetical protein